MSVSSRSATEAPLTERQWVRRGELLESARQVFEHDGYHGATVSAIVQRAGLSQGAFYLYFSDKKGIFAALQEEMATLLRRRIYWATKDERDARRRLYAGLSAYFEFYDDFAAWNRRLSIEGLGIDSTFEERHSDLYRTLGEAFVPTLLELEVRAPSLAAQALMGMAAQLAYWQHFQRSAEQPMSPSELANACAALFITGAASIPAQSKARGGSHARSQRSLH